MFWTVDVKDLRGHNSSARCDLQLSSRVAIVNAIFASSRLSGHLAARIRSNRIRALSSSPLLLRILSYTSEISEGRLDSRESMSEFLRNLLGDFSMISIVRKSQR